MEDTADNQKPAPMKDSTALEVLVAKIQSQLARDAEITHNAHLMGRNSKTMRQIDVLVRQKIGQYEMLIVLDAKDYSRPVDVKGVEEFHGLLEDVGAHKGALVCPRGFSEAAKERARGWQIDLFSPVDTDAHKWQVKVTAPAICDFREAMVSLRFSSSASMPFRLSADMNALEVYDAESRQRLGPPIDASVDNWNKGLYPSEPGTHESLAIYGRKDVLIENGYGQLMLSELTVSILVRQNLYFGHIPIQQLSGFRDELSGAVITNAFTIGLVDPNEVEENWTRINSKEEAPSPVLLTFIGLIGYSS
jgi:hypothetical protein